MKSIEAERELMNVEWVITKTKSNHTIFFDEKHNHL